MSAFNPQEQEMKVPLDVGGTLGLRSTPVSQASTYDPSYSACSAEEFFQAVDAASIGDTATTEVVETPETIEKKGQKYPCSECKTLKYQSGVLILQVDASVDWQGEIFMKCFECTSGEGPWGGKSMWEGMDKEAAARKFKKESDKQWRKRRNCKAQESEDLATMVIDCGGEQSETQVKRMDGTKSQKRAAYFAVSLAKVQEDPKNAQKSREVCKKWARSFVVTLVVQIGADVDPQVGLDLINELQLNLSKEAEGHMPTVPSGKVVDHWQLSYLDKLTKNTDRIFICRKIECRMMCSNSKWISTDSSGGYQFRCPACATQYSAGASGWDLIGANYAITWLHAGQVKYVLTEWPSSAEENFFVQLTEYTAGFTTEDLQLTPQEISAKLDSQLTPAGRPWMREKFDLKPETMKWIDEINRASTKKKWDYSKLRDGWFGARYAADAPIMSYVATKHFIEMLALAWVKRKDSAMTVSDEEMQAMVRKAQLTTGQGSP